MAARAGTSEASGACGPSAAYCPACKELARDPVRLPACQHAICRACARRGLQQSALRHPPVFPAATMGEAQAKASRWRSAARHLSTRTQCVGAAR
jgi:hypothetical protein